MTMRTRVAGGCAAVAVALTGGAVAAPGVAQAEIPGVCGTLFGAGVSVAGIGRTMVARGAGYVGLVVAAGCLAKDVDDAAREYTLTPAAQAEYRRIHARYGGYRADDFLREWGCTPVTRASSHADDVHSHDVTSWDCSRSPYAPGD